MNPVKLSPGNIWSGNRQLAVFTNPTELAFRKGNLKHHWPLKFLGTIYPDAEAAYKTFKSSWDNFRMLQDVMVDIISCKLQQHLVLLETLKLSGGSKFIKECSHLVFPGCQNRLGRWEGWSLESAFIRCLHDAYIRVNDKN